jgi:hypothetical protein
MTANPSRTGSHIPENLYSLTYSAVLEYLKNSLSVYNKLMVDFELIAADKSKSFSAFGVFCGRRNASIK